MDSLGKHQGLQNDTKNSLVGPHKMFDQHLSMSTTVTQSRHQLLLFPHFEHIILEMRFINVISGHSTGKFLGISRTLKRYSKLYSIDKSIEFAELFVKWKMAIV